MNYEKIELQDTAEITDQKIKNEKLISEYSIETSITIRTSINLNEYLIKSINFFSGDDFPNHLPEGFSAIKRWTLYSPAISLKINSDKTVDILVEPIYPMPFSRVIFQDEKNPNLMVKGEAIGICESILGENKVFYQVKTDSSQYLKIPSDQCILDSNYKFLYFYEQDSTQKNNIICAIRYFGELNNETLSKCKYQFYESNNKYKILEENGQTTILVSDIYPRHDKSQKNDSYIRAKKWTDLLDFSYDLKHNKNKTNKP